MPTYRLVESSSVVTRLLVSFKMCFLNVLRLHVSQSQRQKRLYKQYMEQLAGAYVERYKGDLKPRWERYGYDAVPMHQDWRYSMSCGCESESEGSGKSCCCSEWSESGRCSTDSGPCCSEVVFNGGQHFSGKIPQHACHQLPICYPGQFGERSASQRTSLSEEYNSDMEYKCVRVIELPDSNDESSLVCEIHQENLKTNDTSEIGENTEGTNVIEIHTVEPRVEREVILEVSESEPVCGTTDDDIRTEETSDVSLMLETRTRHVQRRDTRRQNNERRTKTRQTAEAETQTRISNAKDRQSCSSTDETMSRKEIKVQFSRQKKLTRQNQVTQSPTRQFSHRDTRKYQKRDQQLLKHQYITHDTVTTPSSEAETLTERFSDPDTSLSSTDRDTILESSDREISRQSSYREKTRHYSDTEVTTQQSSSIGVTTQPSSFIGVTTQPSSFIGVTTQPSSFIGATTEQSSFIGAATEHSSFIETTTQQSSFIRATTHQSSDKEVSTQLFSDKEGTSQLFSDKETTTQLSSEKDSTWPSSEETRTRQSGEEEINNTVTDKKNKTKVDNKTNMYIVKDTNVETITKEMTRKIDMSESDLEVTTADDDEDTVREVGMKHKNSNTFSSNEIASKSRSIHESSDSDVMVWKPAKDVAERANKYRSKKINKQINQQMKERIHEQMKEKIHGRINDRVNEQIKERFLEKINALQNERTKVELTEEPVDRKKDRHPFKNLALSLQVFKPKQNNNNKNNKD